MVFGVGFGKRLTTFCTKIRALSWMTGWIRIWYCHYCSRKDGCAAGSGGASRCKFGGRCGVILRVLGVFMPRRAVRIWSRIWSDDLNDSLDDNLGDSMAVLLFAQDQ